MFEAAGLTLVAVGLVETPWCAPDEEALVRGVLLGEDREAIAAQRSTVVTAAGLFRLPSGGYFRNAFRYAVGRTAVAARVPGTAAWGRRHYIKVC